MAPDAPHAFADMRFRPLWLEDAGLLKPASEPLEGERETELLIVGAGFTGLWAALLARTAQPERSVMVIDAGTVAAGASGRAAGIVSPSLAHRAARTERLYPEEAAALEALGVANMNALRADLEANNIDCDAHWGGELTVAVGTGGVERLAEEHAALQRHGQDAALLDAEAVRAEIASPCFAGGLWRRGASGTLHPGKLALGMRDAALARGAVLHENTQLMTLRPVGNGVEVRTPGGRIRAERVLLATNAYGAGDKRISRRVARLRDRIIATEPLQPDQLQALGWSARQGVYDTRAQRGCMRLTDDDRIVFGGDPAYGYPDPGMPRPDDEAKAYGNLAIRFFSTFPQLEGVRFSHAWSGPIALTTRMGVHFQRFFSDRVVYAGGYGGFGIAGSRLGARLALAILDREKDPALALRFARTVPHSITGEPLRGFAAALTLYALDSGDPESGWRRRWLRLVERRGIPVR